MTSVQTCTIWRVIDAQWIDEDPAVSVISVVLQANGKEYVVVCSGPKGMRSDEFVPAIIAAGDVLNKSSGGVVVVDQDKDKFDTGNQRAS